MPLPGDLERRFAVDDRCVLITGASSGIGYHAAELFAEAGAIVVLTARRRDRLDILTKKILDSGGRAAPFTFDVSDHVNIDKVLVEIENTVAPIDVLLNNSGLTISKPLLEHSAADWGRVMDVNLHGAWGVAQSVARLMSNRDNLPPGGGSIINVTSIAAVRTLPQVPAYVASKAGLAHLTRSMAIELAQKNIRVNSLAPGYFLTELSENFLQSERGHTMINRVPMKRHAIMNELDGILLLLASDAGSYITGSEMIVDGGMAVAP